MPIESSSQPSASRETYEWGQTLPTLEGDRVRLRWLEQTDVPRLFEIFSDSTAMRYWSSPAQTELAQAQELLDSIHQHFRERSLFQWGVARRSDNLIIGTTTLFDVRMEHRKAEIGYMLDRQCWGQGLMQEALRLYIQFAFGTLGLHRLTADVDPRNERSITILERLGFQREGVMRETYWVGGEVSDSLMLGLLAPDWARMLART